MARGPRHLTDTMGNYRLGVLDGDGISQIRGAEPGRGSYDGPSRRVVWMRPTRSGRPETLKAWISA